MKPPSKQCFKCKKVKTLDAFYAHPRMKDGHVNKCIECTKNDTVTREKRLRNDDPVWTQNEIKRNRVRSRGRKIVNRPQYQSLYHSQFPEKYHAKIKVARIKVAKGMQKHHWSYNADHAKDIIVLNSQHHAKAHRFMKYDQVLKLYRRIDTNEPLDTRDKHLAFITHCINNEED